MPLRFRILPAPASTRAAPADRADAGELAVAPSPPRERTFELVEDLEQILVGRRMGASIELPFPAVSAEHARLSRGKLPGDWWVEDLGSTNGSWLDGQRLEPGRPRPLRNGQRLRFATVDLVFEGWSSTPHDGESTATIARRLVGDLLGAVGGEAPTLTVEAGPASGFLRLGERNRRYLVGRGDGCDLPLAVEHVSRGHAVFLRGMAGVVVEDQGSKNGIEVNGRRISGEQRLGDGDRVTIGPVTLRLSDPEDRYLRRLASVKDDVTVPPAATVAPSPAGSVVAADAVASSPPTAVLPAPTAPTAESTPTPPMRAPPHPGPTAPGAAADSTPSAPPGGGARSHRGLAILAATLAVAAIAALLALLLAGP